MSAAATVLRAPTILDIEASGFGRGSYPIEIGFIDTDGEGFCTLIRPAPRWTHWDEAAERVHNIPLRLLFDRGRALNEVAVFLNDALHGQEVYSDGWTHDYSWLNLLFEEAGMTPSFHLENLRKLLSESESAVWHATRLKVENELAVSRHRASNDARVLQATWLRVKAWSARQDENAGIFH